MQNTDISIFSWAPYAPNTPHATKLNSGTKITHQDQRLFLVGLSYPSQAFRREVCHHCCPIQCPLPLPAAPGRRQRRWCLCCCAARGGGGAGGASAGCDSSPLRTTQHHVALSSAIVVHPVREKVAGCDHLI
jgi:hypothetical protein